MSEVGSVGEWVEEARRQEAGTDACIPRFYNRAKPNAAKSEIEGRACFDNVPYVEIFIPGDKQNRPNVKVTDEHKLRWGRQWADFERGVEISEEGTPLEAWAYLNPGRVAELKVLSILNVEMLAAVSDSNLDKLGHGARKLRERARQYLKPQKETETELRRENKELVGNVEQLTEQVTRLVDQVARLESGRVSIPVASENRDDVERFVTS